MNIEDFKFYILYKLDVMEFLDICQIDFADLLDKFDDEINNNWEALEDACR